MYRYAQIDENGFVFCDSYLSGIIEAPNLILIDFDFDLTNKKYENGKWVTYTKEPKIVPYEPTNAEIAQLISDLQADILIGGL